jgi:RimJ/RimL family protein N-acetyltransferase
MYPEPPLTPATVHTQPNVGSAGPLRAAHRSRRERRWHIRRLWPGDALRLAACFERMSAGARQARFFAAKNCLTQTELAHLCRPDGWEHIALGAFAVDTSGRERELLGAVRCLRLPNQRDTADFAIAIADDARGLGLGSDLLTALTRHARTRGVRTLSCDVLAHNRAMRALAERFGAERVGGDAGTVGYRIPLLPARTTGGLSVDWAELPLPDPVAAQYGFRSLLDQAAALWFPGAWGPLDPEVSIAD